MFQDRDEAGGRLAQAVAALALKDPVVLALPRGGVPVAAPVAKALGAPLDLVLVRKIGMPGNPELAAGALVDGAAPVVVWNHDLLDQSGLRPEDFEDSVAAELDRIAARRTAWFADREPEQLTGRSLVVVDDGIATGATMRAALKALRAQEPARLVLAVPVAPAEARAEFARLVDDYIALEEPAFFGAVGAHYRVFGQVEDAEVARQLAAS